MIPAIISALPIPLAEAMKTRGVWGEGCPVSLKRLNLIRVQYFDFQGQEHADGEIVALDIASKHIAIIFSSLYAKRFPINKIRSIHHYSGSDELSMADNNTSCFNFRKIEGGSKLSLHSYGLAIDLNPQQNPIVNFDTDTKVADIHPQKALQFLDRQNQRPGMVESIVSIFAKHGFFVWGGNWTKPIDYHHFQIPGWIAELLVIMDKDDGTSFFELCITQQDMMSKLSQDSQLEQFIHLYKNYRTKFFDTFSDYLSRYTT